MAHHVVACQQIPEQVLGAVQPASASAGRGQQPGPAETAFASKPAKAEPSCSSKNPSESEPSDLSDPASNSCHSCARGNVAARQPGSIFGHPFPWPPGIPFFALPWAAGQRSCSYSHLLFFDLFGQSDQIILLTGLCSGYLKFCLTLSTLQTDTDHSSETRASCTHKLTSVFHSGPNVLLCKSNVNGVRFFLGVSSSSSSRIMSSMLFNIRRNRF